jgi:bifunctional DNA-binding transcriptional regulator/antitoxin component of YhaV-PrlF toxin-antitoxin module
MSTMEKEVVSTAGSQIPAAVRKQLGVRVGDMVAWGVNPMTGQLYVRRFEIQERIRERSRDGAQSSS